MLLKIYFSLPGYINKGEREQFVDCAIVLEEYGGDNDRGRLAYKKRIDADISEKLEIRDKIIGQSIKPKELIRLLKLGGCTFYRVSCAEEFSFPFLSFTGLSVRVYDCFLSKRIKKRLE